MEDNSRNDLLAARTWALGASDSEPSILAESWIEPPFGWSDSLFAVSEPEAAAAFERQIISSAFAYAAGEGKVAQGMLPTTALLEQFQRSRAIDRVYVEQLCDVALSGAPILPAISLPEIIFWIGDHSRAIRQLAEYVLLEMQNRPSHIILTPWLDSGGAELVVLWHAEAIAACGGRALVIGTDGPSETWVSRLPRSAQYLNLPRLIESRGLSGQLSAADQAAALAIVFSQIDFQCFHVVNSYIGYQLLKLDFLRQDQKLFVSLFGIGRDRHGLEAGYWFEVNKLRGSPIVLSDNWTLPRSRAASFGISLESVRSISYPVNPSRSYYTTPRASGAAKKRVLWASRLDGEKLPNLVLAIARLLPGVEFHMFGRSVLNDCRLEEPPENVFLRGPFDGWASLPREEFDGFLFTSKWEGLPNIILEAMGSGLPILASSVGAVPEVLNSSRGWLVDDVMNADAYASALQVILGDPNAARERADAALAHVVMTRNFDAFVSQLRDVQYLGAC